MKIERFFYTENKELLAQIDAEVAAEKAAMSEAEIAAEKEKATKEIRGIFADVAQHRAEHPRLLNAKKVAAFQRLSKAALLLAEVDSLDIVIEDLGEHTSQIKFSSECFFIQDFADPQFKQIFLDLIKTADDIAFSASGGLLKMQFFFTFTEEL